MYPALAIKMYLLFFCLYIIIKFHIIKKDFILNPEVPGKLQSFMKLLLSLFFQ